MLIEDLAALADKLRLYEEVEMFLVKPEPKKDVQISDGQSQMLSLISHDLYVSAIV